MLRGEGAGFRTSSFVSGMGAGLKDGREMARAAVGLYL